MFLSIIDHYLKGQNRYSKAKCHKVTCFFYEKVQMPVIKFKSFTKVQFFYFGTKHAKMEIRKMILYFAQDNSC